LTVKKRLDIALFEGGHTNSREKAKALIMAGQVYVNGQKESKSGAFVRPDDKIEVKGEKLPFVSRGGLKLQRAIQNFNINLKDCVCLDIGASTGGFTDCMLQNNAVRVYAVDVGYGQLAWKLRTDRRVISLERTNFRYITKEQLPEEIDFASIDVSFISLKIILPVLFDRLKTCGYAVALIKPQFEAGREHVGKNGVVRDRAIHISVIKNTLEFTLKSGFDILGLDYSPIKGPCGNIEYLMFLKKSEEPNICGNVDVEHVVMLSHESLNDGEKE
jgi:23S rRNA (cytidine1920-2'-O)/16S rRNA (cytidine1409-2'-O)-methyltransferase